MSKDTGYTLVKWYIVGIIIFLAAILLLSCEVLKKRKSETSATTKIATIDSGKSETTTVKETSKENWWRDIIEYIPKGDTTTTVINNYTTAPVRVIREGGTIQKETDFEKLFFEYLNKKDTATAVINKVDNTTQRKLLTIWHLLAVGGGAVLVTLLINKLKIVRA